MAKIIGVQKELNELAEALTVNGYEVTNIINTSKNLDAIIYYEDEKSNTYNLDQFKNRKNKSNKDIVEINAAKTNINQIMEILRSI